MIFKVIYGNDATLRTIGPKRTLCLDKSILMPYGIMEFVP